MRSFVCAAIACSAFAAPAAAQTRERDVELRELRLEHVAERQVAGGVLLGWGAANLVAGSLVAAIGHDEPALVGGGIISASFGLVNGLLALTLFDLSGTLREEADEGRLGDERDRDDVLRLAIAAQLKTGQTFAVNVGFDVGYIVAGALVFALGLELDEDAVAGAGIAGAGQGLFLLGFDLAEWILSNARAEELLEHADE
jgi:hypothetical protein